jgi:hypothetical protein
MSTAVMTERIAEASPRFKARMAGVAGLKALLEHNLELNAIADAFPTALKEI